MAKAPLSTRARVLIRSLGWAVLVSCLLGYSLGRAEETAAGLLVAQIAFDGLLALAVAACLLAWQLMRAENPFEGRLWARLSLAVTFLLLAEVYYSVYQVAVDSAGPGSPSPFELLSALAAVAYIAILWSMSRLRVLPVTARGRLVSGMAGQMVIVFAMLYWGVAKPMASGVSNALIDPLLWVVYMCVGLAVLVGTFTDIFGMKIARWSSWESLVAWSLVLLGFSLLLWPYWSRSAATQGMAEQYHLLPLLLAASYGSTFLGALYRLTAPWPQWRSAPLPPPRATALAGSRTFVSTVQALAIPVFGLMLYLRPAASADRVVLLGLIFCVTLALVVRTGFLSAELLQARIRTAKDPLTGALRHSFFIEQLEGVIDEARRHGEPVSVGVFDVDDFARTNVIDGHATGDAILSAIGSAVPSMLETGELFGRLGGDEFALCLRKADLSHAMQRLRREQPVLNDVASKGSQPVTLSFGVATFP
jgi:diguanylate cyclase (GGDEF)-like protein